MFEEVDIVLVQVALLILEWVDRCSSGIHVVTDGPMMMIIVTLNKDQQVKIR